MTYQVALVVVDHFLTKGIVDSGNESPGRFLKEVQIIYLDLTAEHTVFLWFALSTDCKGT